MKPEAIIELAANGNEAARAFALAWWELCRMVDDVFDQDRNVTDERLAVVQVRFFTEQAGNPFYLEHRAMLLGVMVLAFNAWLDANRLVGERRAVLSGMYHEVIYLVAYITGGWGHLRKVTGECRAYKEVNHGTV